MLHESTFEYLKPTETQVKEMAEARQITAEYASYLQDALPDGPDKTYVMRKLREIAMWINVTITRQPDGAPR
jgi:hypothetical protein